MAVAPDPGSPSQRPPAPSGQLGHAAMTGEPSKKREKQANLFAGSCVIGM